ncbi:MAG: hypothetical protein P8Z81_11825 [Deinococcales bacterium]
MARPERTVSPSPARRTLRLFALNLLILGGAMVLLWVGYRVLHHPRVAVPPVAMPAGVVTGRAPGPLVSGDYGLTLHGARWIAQSSLPPGLHLTFRARPGPLVDYLVLDVSVRNQGTRPLPLSYLGAGQDVRLLLVSLDPVSYYREPLSPPEAELITHETPLASGTLAPRAERRGVLVYAVERFRKRFELVATPETGAGAAAGPALQQPAIEMHFTP